MSFKMTELAMWKKMLSYLQYENSHMKNDLANLLKHDVEGIFTETMEAYQTRFINFDALILLLLQDIVAIKKMIADTKNATINSQDIKMKINQLHKEIQKTELTFTLLKTDFNNFYATDSTL